MQLQSRTSLFDGNGIAFKPVVLRVGRAERMLETVKQVSLDSQVEAYMNMTQADCDGALKEISKQLDLLDLRLRNIKVEYAAVMAHHFQQLHELVVEEMQREVSDIVEQKLMLKAKKTKISVRHAMVGYVTPAVCDGRDHSDQGQGSEVLAAAAHLLGLKLYSTEKHDRDVAVG